VVAYEILVAGPAEVHVLHEGYVGYAAEGISTVIIPGHGVPFRLGAASGRVARG
jgi:hypothetical protein